MKAPSPELLAYIIIARSQHAARKAAAVGKAVAPKPQKPAAALPRVKSIALAVSGLLALAIVDSVMWPADADVRIKVVAEARAAPSPFSPVFSSVANPPL
jgi:hypothetical protein